MTFIHSCYRRIITLTAVCVLLISSNASARDDIRMSGSSTVAPVMIEIVRLFEQGGDKPRVFVETGGSSRGITDLRKGLTDIAMVSRSLKASESDLVAHTVARDGIAVLVNANNPVSELSTENLKAIFTGKISNWQDVGGNDREIFVVSKGEGSATSVVLNEYLDISADQVSGDIVAAANAHMIKTLSLTPDGIGYVSIGAASVDIALGVPVKLIPLGQIPATLENVSNGSYKATRPLNLVTGSTGTKSVLDLIEFSTSAASSDSIRRLAYSPTSQ